MDVLVLLLISLTGTLAISPLGFEGSTRAGRPIPLHIPSQIIESNVTFEIPYWLGAFYAIVEIPLTNWTLPLTIGNGGQAYPGEFLFIRNYGPEAITLYSTQPETIDGAPSYLIQAGTVVQIISGYPNWIVASSSTSSQPAQWMNTFSGIDMAVPAPVFTVQIGTNTLNPPPNNPECGGSAGTCANWDTVSIGDAAGQYQSGIRVNNLGPRSGQNNTGINVNNFGRQAGQSNTGTGVNNLGSLAGQSNTGSNTNNLGNAAGQNNIASDANNLGNAAGQGNSGGSANNMGGQSGQFNSGGGVNNMGRLSGQYNSGSNVNNLGLQAGQYNTGTNVNNMGNLAGQNNTGQYCSHDGYSAGRLNTFNYCHTNGRDSACTAANQFVFGAIANPLNLRLPSDIGSFCMGASYDTCLNYGRAGAWTLGTGQDLYSTGYFCAGAGCTNAAPVSTATGLYDSNVRVVRSCTAGAGITCSVTDGVITVTANANLQEKVTQHEQKIAELQDTIAELKMMILALTGK